MPLVCQKWAGLDPKVNEAHSGQLQKGHDMLHGMLAFWVICGRRQ